MKRQTLYCPKCNNELFLDGISANGDFLACKNKECYAYFIKEEGENVLKEIGSYLGVISEMENKGLSNWPGIQTSSISENRCKRLFRIFLKK